MIANIPSATLVGVQGRSVGVEVHVSNGLPGFTVVGLPDAACRESRDRVRAALLSSGLPWMLRRVTVNLAPSGERKGGAGLDLPIAVGLLVAASELPASAIEGCAFLGELGLDGSIRPVRGTLALVDAMKSATVVVSPLSAQEAGLPGRHQVRAAPDLAALVDVLKGRRPWPSLPEGANRVDPARGPDLAEVRGQAVGRRALEVAAAGGHHLLLVGPPGSGKTMLARRLPGLLPHLSRSQALEVARIHSAAGLELADGALEVRPPFRAPHHLASVVSLVGGGSSWLRPGEVSLAHRGVLFLDELAELPSTALEALRQPLEEGVIRVSRARATASFPARFLLVAAVNPCPCGEGMSPGACRCSDTARARYARRLSGPLLDRFDMRLPVVRPSAEDMVGAAGGETTAEVAERVAEARSRAVERGVTANAELDRRRLDEEAPLSESATALLERRLRSGSLSARGLVRIRRVSRTVADLAGSGRTVELDHVAAALELRGGLSMLAPTLAA